MPGHYVGKNFDLAGFSVGCVDEDKVINNKTIKKNDVLIGIESSGPHSNGFSLIRKIIKESKLNNDEYNHLVDLALKPTHLYPNLIMGLLEKFTIHGMAHITGGGLTENIPRSIPKNLAVNIDTNSWHMPEIFKWLKTNGNLKNLDMYRIFNCGIGMVLIVRERDSGPLIKEISKHNFKSFIIGNVIDKDANNSIVFT